MWVLETSILVGRGPTVECGNNSVKVFIVDGSLDLGLEMEIVEVDNQVDSHCYCPSLRSGEIG